MTKLALIFHGWGCPTTKVHILSKYLTKNGYDSLIPRYLELESPFNIQNVIAEADQQLNNREPQIIAGISLGGMILPHIAQNFPQAKLIFIASGPYFKPESAFLEILMNLIKTKIGALLFRLIQRSPKKIIIPIYKIFYPFKSRKELLKEYEEEIQTNVDYLSALPFNKYTEVIEFAKKTNDTALLSQLKNDSLIFSGKQDSLIPPSVGKELNGLLENSRLIVNEGSHFDAFTRESLLHLDKFLSI